MTEILIAITLSTVGIILAQYCKGVADSTSYDKKAHDAHAKFMQDVIDGRTMVTNDVWFQTMRIMAVPSTRYHTGDPNDAWHWFSRLSVYLCYASALGAGAYIGISWWLILCVVCNTLGGLIGFNLGDRWRGSMWMRYIGDLING